MPFADLRNQRIYYEDSGGPGPAVLYSHGFLMDRSMFAPQVAALSDAYRCVAWDQRGFGLTEDDRKEFSYWDSAEDALALLDHLGIDEAVWVGMSQGGFLSLRAALTQPDRVRGLVLVDSAADTDDAATVAGYQAMVGGWVQGDAAERSELVEVVAGLILGDEALAAEWIPGWMEQPPERIVAPAGALLERDDLTARLGEIAAPALVVHGTEDQAIAMARGEALCAGLPDCRGLVRVEGAAHTANLSHPEVVNPPLRRFLDEITA